MILDEPDRPALQFAHLSFEDPFPDAAATTGRHLLEPVSGLCFVVAIDLRLLAMEDSLGRVSGEQGDDVGLWMPR